MSSALLHHRPYPLSLTDPATAAAIASQASTILSKSSPSPDSLLSKISAFLSSTPLLAPLASLLHPESHVLWTAHEEVLRACLVTGDLTSARRAADALTRRFGVENERVMALRGMCDEAEAGEDEGRLRKVLEGYERMGRERGENLPIRKRKIALLRSMNRPQRAIEELVALLDIFAVDGESWAELAEVYVEQGAYAQAVYCLEEVLLIAPNAWNMHARLAEVQYMSAKAIGNSSGSNNNNNKNNNSNSNSSNDASMLAIISEAMGRFCRSVELCDDYLRGYCGLKVTSAHILSIYSRSPKLAPPESTSPPPPSSSSSSSSSSSAVVATPSSSKLQADGTLPPPTRKDTQRLNELATARLATIVRKAAARESGWEGYDEREVRAVREMLDGEAEEVVR